MRQHCTQCLTELFTAQAQVAPSGEVLCEPCHSALWGPTATNSLRLMVERHSGLSNGQPEVAPAS